MSVSFPISEAYSNTRERHGIDRRSFTAENNSNCSVEGALTMTLLALTMTLLQSSNPEQYFVVVSLGKNTSPFTRV